ncbi:MAG TPA: type II secretion system F family protein [Bacillota bacterium]|nr:type II secretion system F family protein [Bacillota bacterium]
MLIPAEPVMAAALAAFGLLLVLYGGWLHAQASVSATAWIVAQARGDPAALRTPRRTVKTAVRRTVDRLACRLGPLAGPLGTATLKRRLDWLGAGQTPEQFLARQVLLACAGLVAGAALPVLAGFGAAAVVVAPTAAAVGWWLPWRDLDATARAERRALSREALGWGDFLTAAVQAGLQLDAAIVRLARELPGRLPRLLGRAVRQSELTREPLDLCLAAAAAEIGEPNVGSLVATIIQARETGGDLAGPLSGLVAALRQERQQQLRTAARGRSTLGALPLIFVMLPGVMLPLGYIVLTQFRSIGY